MHPMIVGLALCSHLATVAAATVPSHPASPANRATTLYQNTHCGGDAGLEQISGNARLEALKIELGQHRPDESPPEFIAVTATPDTLTLLLRMGLQPTPGYGATPGELRPSPDGRELVISVDWHSPPEGVLLPQMITTPCVLFSIEGSPYATIRLIDQDGIQRGQIKPTTTTAAPGTTTDEQAVQRR